MTLLWVICCCLNVSPHSSGETIVAPHAAGVSFSRSSIAGLFLDRGDSRLFDPEKLARRATILGPEEEEEDDLDDDRNDVATFQSDSAGHPRRGSRSVPSLPDQALARSACRLFVLRC